MKLGSEAKLHVKIMSPTQILYEGAALSVSANNKVGPFDILADHANFFSLLSEGSILVNIGMRTLTIPVQQGIIKVTNNSVTLFIDIEPAYMPENNSQQ
jgi:F0F1-type ATP synthase epsilon subunit